MVVYKNAQILETGEQDVPGGDDRAEGVAKVFWFAGEQFKTVLAVEKGAVYASVVGAFVVDDAVSGLAQKGTGQKGREDVAVFDLGESYHVRKGAEAVSNVENGFGDAVAFRFESFAVPALGTGGRVVVEEVLDIPEYNGQRVFGGRCPGSGRH